MLLSEYPNLISEWDFTKNIGLDPAVLKDGSHKKVWWVCTKGHSWQAVISSRTRMRSGCPYCSGRLAIFGVNDLATLHPDLVKEWDYEKNISFSPTEILPRSNKKAWWKCSKGHSWETVIAARTQKNPRSCPICSNQRIQVRYNDLATTNPELIKEWDYVKNLPNTPECVFAGSSKKAWWICKKGHSWRAVIASRRRHGCPYCVGRAVSIGENDLLTLRPDIAKDWDHEKNNGLLPSNVTVGSGIKAWWVCTKGHSWQAAICDRTKDRRPTDCPTCWSKTFVSKAEQELLEYVQSLKPDAVGTHKQIPNVSEVDIFIPSLNIAIEYNGIYFHSERTKHRNYHKDKWQACKDQGVQLIQIWEDEWIKKPDIVKKMLAHKLGASSSPKVYAQKTKVVSVNADLAKAFLESNHTQGYVSGSIRVGLEHEGELVALALFKKCTDTSVEFIRYATSSLVVGGQDKILKYLIKNRPDIKKIVTFDDHCISNGDLYERLGFSNAGELNPDYKYLVNNKRVNKGNYSLKKFKDGSDLIYQDGLTESELATLNGLYRIYDAGKTRYVLYT